MNLNRLVLPLLLVSLSAPAFAGTAPGAPKAPYISARVLMTGGGESKFITPDAAPAGTSRNAPLQAGAMRADRHEEWTERLTQHAAEQAQELAEMMAGQEGKPAATPEEIREQMQKLSRSVEFYARLSSRMRDAQISPPITGGW